MMKLRIILEWKGDKASCGMSAEREVAAQREVDY